MNDIEKQAVTEYIDSTLSKLRSDISAIARSAVLNILSNKSSDFIGQHNLTFSSVSKTSQVAISSLMNLIIFIGSKRCSKKEVA